MQGNIIRILASTVAPVRSQRCTDHYFVYSPSKDSLAIPGNRGACHKRRPYKDTRETGLSTFDPSEEYC